VVWHKQKHIRNYRNIMEHLSQNVHHLPLAVLYPRLESTSKSSAQDVATTWVPVLTRWSSFSFVTCRSQYESQASLACRKTRPQTICSLKQVESNRSNKNKSTPYFASTLVALVKVHMPEASKTSTMQGCACNCAGSSTKGAQKQVSQSITSNSPVNVQHWRPR
jgi:hypothetical protein